MFIYIKLSQSAYINFEFIFIIQFLKTFLLKVYENLHFIMLYAQSNLNFFFCFRFKIRDFRC